MTFWLRTHCRTRFPKWLSHGGARGSGKGDEPRDGMVLLNLMMEWNGGESGF